MKYQKTKEFQNTEFEKKVVIIEAEPPKEEVKTDVPLVEQKAPVKPVKIIKPVKKKTVKAAAYLYSLKLNVELFYVDRLSGLDN